MKKLQSGLFAIVLFLGFASPLCAQIRFFEGDFDAALKKAAEEKKNVFVDFYADWCGPCKKIAATVFTIPELGDYFNKQFVCCKIDADKNKELVKKYGVTGLPCMFFLDAQGKVLRQVVGSVAANVLFREARIAAGDEVSFDVLYDNYKKNKKDLDNIQQILLEAPAFVHSLNGYERDKWKSRINVLFPEYLKRKQLENMINEKDLQILEMFHSKMEKNDRIFEFLVKNHDRYVEAVGQYGISPYLIRLNNAWIYELCRKGDRKYKDVLSRLDGDLKNVYAGISFGELDVKQAMTYLADATYSLYHKDNELFFENMEKYFAGTKNSARLDDYTNALESLYAVNEGNLSAEACAKAIDWAKEALKKNPDTELRTRLLMIMAECYVGVDDRASAKLVYNEALLTCARIKNENVRAKFHQMIQQRLVNL